MSKKTKVIAIVAIVLSVILTVGFSFKIKAPKTVYRVYLEGKSLGIIKSKKALENYIDKKQQQIKEQYGVDKVYAPEEFDTNEWTVYGEPETTVTVQRPATVELTCADIVNRIPDVINARPGFVPTSQMPEPTYRTESLDKYLN